MNVDNTLLTDTSFIAEYFSFFDRHSTFDPIGWNDGNQFASLFSIHSEWDVVFFRIEIPSWKWVEIRKPLCSYCFKMWKWLILKDGSRYFDAELQSLFISSRNRQGFLISHIQFVGHIIGFWNFSSHINLWKWED
jgi:hypothetical protein